MSDVVPKQGTGTENFVDKLRDTPLVFGAKAFCRCRETTGCLAQNLANHQDAPNAIAGFKCGDFLAHECIFAVSLLERHFVERMIRNESIDAATFVFELTHCLFKSAAKSADKI